MIQGFSWLELKPQQNFRDEDLSKILGVAGHASEFGFFVFRNSHSIRLVVRTKNEGLWRTIPGMSVARTKQPSFDGMSSKYLVLKKRSLVPLVSLKAPARGSIYSKMWTCQSISMMACLVCDKTRQVCSDIDRRLGALESARKNGSMTGRKKIEHLAAQQKRDHGHYNCCIIFGIKTDANKDAIECKTPYKALDAMVRSMLLNSFAHRIGTRRARLEGSSLMQKITDFFRGVAAIDPATHVPEKLNSRSITLTETELVFFVSFPSEHEMQSINFGIGPTPTFVHGVTDDISNTDITIQKPDAQDNESAGAQSHRWDEVSET